MHEGFKGSHVALETFTVAAVADGTLVLSFSIQFVDDGGIVHAVGRHQIPLKDLPLVAPHLTKAMDEILEWTAKAHYTSPGAGTDGETPKEKTVGIAEYLKGGDIGSQG